jgi:hypothetical protein
MKRRLKIVRAQVEYALKERRRSSLQSNLVIFLAAWNTFWHPDEIGTIGMGLDYQGRFL